MGAEGDEVDGDPTVEMWELKVMPSIEDVLGVVVEVKE